MWVFLAILSAIGLGFYDISKKQALNGQAVLPVLTCSILCSSVILTPMLLMSRLCPDMAGGLFYVAHLSAYEHFLVILKSALVLSSWVCAYCAMKHLPLTLVTPLNATRPMWTLLGAVLLFGEQLNGWQWAGVIVALCSFYAFSLVGKMDGFRWRHNRWIYCLMAAIVLGACSGLYDKHLMRHIDHNAVQVYYTYYQFVMMLILLGFRRLKYRFFSDEEGFTPFRWSWWIVGISLGLVFSDFVYLLALSDPTSLLAVVSLLRRGSVLITFAYGAWVLRESHIRQKAICLSGIVVAMVLLVIGSLS